MSGPNVGFATLSVIPSMRGAQAALAGQIAGPASAAGTTAGASMGGSMLAGLRRVAGPAAVAGSLVGLSAIGSSFRDATNEIRVGTGATGDELAALEQNFRNVFTSVPTDMAGASTAIADLNTRLGLTGEELEARSAQFLELSRITGTDLEGNITSVSRVFGDWGVATGDQEDRLDALFRASQATGSSVDQLSSRAVQFGAPLRQMGFDFEETISLLGAFEKEGVNTELVMGSMRQALGNFAREGEEAPQALSRLMDEISGMESDTDAAARAMEVFGARAGPDMAAAIREGRFDVEDLFDVVANGSETVMGAADDVSDWRQSWQLLKNQVLVALEPVATRLFNALGTGMDLVMRGAAAVSEAFGEGGVAGVFAMLRDRFVEAWPDIRAALGEFAGNVLEWIAETAPVIAEQLVEWAAEFVEWILPQIPPALEALGELLLKVGEWVVTEGVPLLARKLVEWGGAFLAWIGPQIPPLLVELGKLLVSLGNWIVEDALPAIATKLGEWAGEFVGWAPGAALDLVSTLFTWFTTDFLPWLGRRAADLGEKLLEWVGEFAAAGLEAGKEFIAGVGRGLRDIPVLGRGISPWFDIGFSNPFTAHTGGVVPGRPGQEVPSLLMAGETVLPTHRNDYDPGEWGVSSGGGLTIEHAVFGDRNVVRDLDFWAQTNMAGV